MINIIVGVIALFITVPVLMWMVLYLFIAVTTKNKKRAFQISTDISTFFAIVAVHLLIFQIWHMSLLWLLILLILLSGIGFTWLFWRSEREMNAYNIFRGTWRFNFLFFMLSYIILFLYGIISGLMNITS